MATTLKFTGVDIVKEVSDYSVENNPVAKGKRNADGNFIGDKINDKAKIIVVWSSLTGAELATLHTYFDLFIISVTYVNPKTNSTRTASFYTSPVKQKAFKYNATTGKIELYENVSINLIEV
jgi:hypothetical protein